MKKVLLLVTALMFTVAIGSINTAYAVVVNNPYTSESGNFKINFPGTPEVANEKVPTEVGDIQMYTFMYEKSITEAYMVAYSDYPSALVEASNPKDLLQGGKDGALSSLAIDDLDEEKDISINGYPGLYFKGKSTSNTYHVVYEVYMVENRLYQVAILRDGTYPDNDNVKDFIKTFRLLKDPKSIGKSNHSTNTADKGGTGKGYSSSDGKFKIDFPGAPKEASETVPTDVGDIEMTTFMYEKSLSEAYMVAYSDYPSAMVEASNTNDLLDGGKNGALSSLGIENLEDERDITLKGNKGKAFKGNNGTYFVVYEIYLVKNRLYQIAILKEGSYPTVTDVKSFIGSFQLTK